MRASSFQEDSLADKSFQRTASTTELSELERTTLHTELAELERPALTTELSQLERTQLQRSSFAESSFGEPNFAQLCTQAPSTLGSGSFKTSPRRRGVLRHMELCTLTLLDAIVAQACLQLTLERSSLSSELSSFYLV